MKRLATFLMLTTLGNAPLSAMPSQITFQGTLKQQGVPVNATKNMQFSFVDRIGNPIPGTTLISIANVPVANGLFAVQLPIDLSIPWEQYTPFIRVYVEGQTLQPDQPLNANLYVVAAIPAGIIAPFGGQTPPPGWFLCDGSAVNRITYAGLFLALGTTWGGGDGSTTFNLPDLRGRAPIGAGQGPGLTNRGLATTLGEETHTLVISELPVTGYVVNDPGHSHGTPSGGSFYTNNHQLDVAFGAGAQIGAESKTATNTTGVTVSVPNGGNAHNVMQPSAVVNFIIKY